MLQNKNDAPIDLNASFISKNNILSMGDVPRRISEIKQERKELRVKLDQFQKNFEQVHNRKIRYTKDVVPVQNEFKKYKDLKNDLARLEDMLKKGQF